MITYIVSCLIIKPKISNVAERAEYSIFWLSMNFLKHKNPDSTKNAAGAWLKEVWEYAKKIVVRPSKKASDIDVEILKLKERDIKKKIAIERDENNGP